jgi:CheY-like chemotaxis protein
MQRYSASTNRAVMPGNKPLHKHILLVDDEGTVRETLRLLLLHDQHTVVEANNGAEALGLFTRGRYDLVMLDYEMPFMKGDELALRIKRVAPGQPILMITAYALKPSPENPVDAILNKPFDIARLRQVMARLLAEPDDHFSGGAEGEPNEISKDQAVLSN